MFSMGASPRTPIKQHRSKNAPVQVSVLNMIDLAGSERISDDMTRRKEGAFINRSLLTLGNVISKLSSSDRNKGHIPYRDSKLTRILQKSLDGNAFVGVICTVSPQMNNSEETIKTLGFAQRAKKIETKAEISELVDEKTLLKQYRDKIRQLEDDLKRLKTPMKQPSDDSHISKFVEENQKLQNELQEKDLIQHTMRERINQLTKMILTSKGPASTLKESSSIHGSGASIHSNASDTGSGAMTDTMNLLSISDSKGTTKSTITSNGNALDPSDGGHSSSTNLKQSKNKAYSTNAMHKIGGSASGNMYGPNIDSLNDNNDNGNHNDTSIGSFLQEEEQQHKILKSKRKSSIGMESYLQPNGGTDNFALVQSNDDIYTISRKSSVTSRTSTDRGHDGVSSIEFPEDQRINGKYILYIHFVIIHVICI